jgi:hypothetical protein
VGLYRGRSYNEVGTGTHSIFFPQFLALKKAPVKPHMLRGFLGAVRMAKWWCELDSTRVGKMAKMRGG